jgi:hypothetical protein
MPFSGHRTRSTLDRYHVIDLDDLRAAAERASDYRAPRGASLRYMANSPSSAPGALKRRPRQDAGAELSEC